MESFESNLSNFLTILEQLSDQKSQSNRDLLSFWRDSFFQYISKMKRPKHIDKHPRRFFHLHAMNYVLEKTKPILVWNLCVGNSKTSVPVLEKFIELAKQKQSIFYWINIDFIPELKIFNQSFLKDYFSSALIKKLGPFEYIEYKNIKIFNITGYLEDFFKQSSILSSVREFPSQILLCLDGISNIAIEPANWLEWWNHLTSILMKYFSGWYFTLLYPSTLQEKFDFYYNVVLLKHHIPLQWIETSLVDITTDTKGKLHFSSEPLGFTKFSATTIDEFLSVYPISNSNIIFRFFSNESKSLLVYQALYLTEESLRLLVNKSVTTFIGHKEIDELLFEITNDFYDNKDQNFVKSIPYIGFNENL